MKSSFDADESGSQADVEEELGDLLLAVTNLARHLNVNPEEALRKANSKFTRRFNALEAHVNSATRDWPEYTPEELEDAWQKIK